ncbi:PREDICTED: leucine-rich repeat-containing protein 71-like [Habropoda laboriosa]|uniref:leucine-rich repeat-containing protein 71-like n=1 Tax=Habropoda laboriosa TaxID=597456 RepID=UPI00083D983C|nr:PREDICTED: leucine-rich repeat-containing protein 71-like [Habropoda laboriosa]
MQIAEMTKNIGCLEELNLDMNPNAQENYHLLCTPAGSLQYLSLRLCNITDEGVEKIAKELRYQDPPNNPKLIILNLAHNHVTKDGAFHVARMLRTNRSLRCLVLLGNRICDEGASLILQELRMYP